MKLPLLKKAKKQAKTYSRGELLRGYTAAEVWFYGVVTAEYIAQTFNAFEPDREKTTAREVSAAALQYAAKNEVYTKRREFFVSTYAFEGKSFKDIESYAKSAANISRQEYEREDILKYCEIGYIPTTPERDRFLAFLAEIKPDRAYEILNRMEKEFRLGNRGEDVVEAIMENSGIPEDKREECKKAAFEMAKKCPNWSQGGTFDQIGGEAPAG
jgi:hypothetical protein